MNDIGGATNGSLNVKGRMRYVLKGEMEFP
jgi:hypothetical protein